MLLPPLPLKKKTTELVLPKIPKSYRKPIEASFDSSHSNNHPITFKEYMGQRDEIKGKEKLKKLHKNKVL